MSTTNTPPERRKLLIFAWGDVAHDNGDFVVDRKFVDDIVSAFVAFKMRGYYPPVLRQHSEDGFTYGRVVDLRFTPDGLEAVLELPVALAKAFDDGYLDSWSPSFVDNFSDPHTKETYPRMLRELSFVSVRYLKNIPGASPYYSLAEDGKNSRSLAEYITEVESMPEELAMKILETLASIDARLQAIEAKAADAEPEAPAEDMPEETDAPEAPSGEDDQAPPAENADGEEEDAPAPPVENADGEEEEEEDAPTPPIPTPNSEPQALATELAELRKENLRLRLTARLPHATEAQITALAETPEGARETLIESLANARHTNLGEQGTAAPGANVDRPTELCEKVKEEGGNRMDAWRLMEREGINIQSQKALNAVGRVFPRG